jgi:hypothetical protein
LRQAEVVAMPALTAMDVRLRPCARCFAVNPSAAIG